MNKQSAITLLAIFSILFTFIAQPALAGDGPGKHGFYEVPWNGLYQVPPVEAQPLLCPITGSVLDICEGFWEASDNFLSSFCCTCLTNVPDGKGGFEPATDHPDCGCCADECLVYNANFQLIGNACEGCTAPMHPTCE